MKKTFLAIFTILLFVGVLPAAAITWTANGWGTAVSGQVYLLQATGTAPEISAVASYLETNGTSHSGEGFINYGNTTIADAVNIGTVVLSDVQSPNDNLANFFTLIVTNDGQFYLSTYSSLQDLTGPSGELYTASFNPFVSTTWYSGVLGDVVPEPTALALLALGVAGLALRRRCA